MNTRRPFDPRASPRVLCPLHPWMVRDRNVTANIAAQPAVLPPAGRGRRLIIPFLRTRSIQAGGDSGRLISPMNFFFRSLLLAGALLSAAVARAADLPAPASTPVPGAAASARSVLRKAIEPVVSLFVHAGDGPNHAWVLRLRLAESNVHPPELQGSTFSVRMMTAPSDKVLFQYPALGTTITVCRQGQTVWASPASRLAPFLQKVEANPPTAADRKPLASLRMPVPEALFWVGFYLVGIKDRGSEPVDGVACRVLDVDPPDDSGKVSAENYTRLFIRPDTAQFVRFERKHGTEHSVYAVDQNRILPTLPDSDFQPTATQRADLLEVPAERFRAFMKAVGDEEEKRRKAQREQPGKP